MAGAISFAGLFAGQDTFALAGTLTSAGATTTPRESSGASGGATLISTGASASASASSESASTPQTTASTESSSPSGRTQRGTRRHAQTEENTTHHRTGGGSASHTSRQGGKAVVESKDQKAVVPVPTAPDTVHFSLSAGFETRYIYHGLDIIGFNSKLYTTRLAERFSDGSFRIHRDENSSSAIEYSNADVAFKGFHLGLGYVRAIDATYPFFQQPTVRDVHTTAGQDLRAYTTDSDAIPGTHRRHYQEVDVNADYTVSIVAGILDGTVGYNSYFFAYHDYKGSSYQGELFGRLAYKQLKYVVPSFTFYRYFSNYDTDSAAGNLNGSYAEFRIDGAVPVYNSSMVGVTLAPYIAAGYNISYLKYGNNDVGGWNDLEMGIKLPTRLGQHFTVTPYGNYGLDISSQDGPPINNFTGNGYGERTHFWGGVTVAYSF